MPSARLQRSGDRLLMGITLQMIAGTLAATQPDAAAIIMGAAEAHVIESAGTAQLITSTVAAAVGEERARELHAPRRGAWTGIKPSPTPSAKPRKHSPKPNPRSLHEQVRDLAKQAWYWVCRTLEAC